MTDTQTQKPRRACLFELTLEGDDRQAIVNSLISIATLIDRGEISSGCSGGYDSGYVYTYKESDRPTHDEYIQALNKYLEGQGIFMTQQDERTAFRGSDE